MRINKLGKIFPPAIHSFVRLLRGWRKRLQVQLGPKLSLGERPSHPEVIISVTTFPPRVRQCSIALESIFQQTIHPAAVVLSLAVEEFPGRRIPRPLRNLVTRGLTILWVEVNNKSYDKLLSAKLHFPELAIITVDDDKLLNPKFLEEMVDAHHSTPDCVVGYRGWDMRSSKGAIHYGKDWVRADKSTPSWRLFLPGNGGVLYPKHAISEKLHDMDVALLLAPTADDIWFWGLVHDGGIEMRCLGKPPHTPIATFAKSPALRDINETLNDVQFQRVIDHFGLREKLLKMCSVH